MSFIKLDRRLLNWEWKDDPYMVALWIEILLQANYEDSRWHGEVFQRGTFPTSISKLAKATGLTERKVRTCLKRLEKSQELTYKATKQGTVIKVNKWDVYQGYDPASDTQSDKRVTHKRQTSDNSLRNKEVKKERNIYNSVPVYDPSNNMSFTDEERDDLLKMMGRS